MPYSTLLQPQRILLLGFIFIIVAGTFILTLPIASTNGSSQSFIDALFTATSAISTTGLVVVDIGSYYSLFGQVVILVLVQIGGLGYMIFIALVMSGLGIRLSLSGKLVIGDSLGAPPYKNVAQFSKIIICTTFLFEFLGAMVLSLYWMREFPVKHALYLGVFHSVSAFCTAGFSLFPDNLCAYRDSIVVNVTIYVLCIVGSMGFIVIYDIYHAIFGKMKDGDPPKRLLVHTKLVLVMIPMILIVGVLLLFASEWFTPQLSIKDRVLTALFQAVSASTTTGFNTLDTGTMKTAGLTTMIILMYIGASPGSTGGGVKTTTFGISILSVFSLLSTKDELVLFNRRISAQTAGKAFAICALALLLIFVDVLLLSFTENASFMGISFEVISAFGTVGLSTGITPSLSATGKIVLCGTMLIGRIGPLAIGFSIRGKGKIVPVKYPEGVMLIG